MTNSEISILTSDYYTLDGIQFKKSAIILNVEIGDSAGDRGWWCEEIIIVNQDFSKSVTHVASSYSFPVQEKDRINLSDLLLDLAKKAEVMHSFYYSRINLPSPSAMCNFEKVDESEFVRLVRLGAISIDKSFYSIQNIHENTSKFINDTWHKMNNRPGCLYYKHN